MEIIEALKNVGGFILKGVGEPEYYLGRDVDGSANLEKDGDKTKLSAKTYIKNMVDRVEKEFNITLRNYHSSLEGGYHPELDTTPLLNDDGITRYMMCIGCINWAVTIGSFDTMFAAITMASYSAVPREGHLKVVLHIIGYLKYHANGAIQMIVAKPNFRLDDDSDIVAIKWRERQISSYMA